LAFVGYVIVVVVVISMIYPTFDAGGACGT
jgi:hypothetical protein